MGRATGRRCGRGFARGIKLVFGGSVWNLAHVGGVGISRDVILVLHNLAAWNILVARRPQGAQLLPASNMRNAGKMEGMLGPLGPLTSERTLKWTKFMHVMYSAPAGNYWNFSLTIRFARMQKERRDASTGLWGVSGYNFW